MIKTINFTMDVTSERKVEITLPEDVPLGPAEIVIVVAPHNSKQSHTLGELARSEFFGMWRDRTDISDSAEFARRLRNEAWSRNP